jgi:hypothetical protein
MDNNEKLVRKVFDPRGVQAPRWQVFVWRGDQRVVLSSHRTESEALKAAR